MRTLEIIEATEAATSAHDAEQADVEETRNMGETPRNAGRERRRCCRDYDQSGRNCHCSRCKQHQGERPLEPQSEAE
jgi:hypothetical protein